MMKPFCIAVFASGNGSNFQAIVDAVAESKLDVTIGLLVCDRPQAAVIERARRAGIPLHVFNPQDYAAREQYEAEILHKLEAMSVDLVVLAGYMRLLTDTLVKPYAGRMINIHPALLPAFPGINAVKQAIDYGVKVTGVTVHYVDSGIDSGAIIAQRALEVRDEDTEKTLAVRIHQIEHEMYPQVIQAIREGYVKKG